MVTLWSGRDYRMPVRSRLTTGAIGCLPVPGRDHRGLSDACPLSMRGVACFVFWQDRIAHFVMP